MIDIDHTYLQNIPSSFAKKLHTTYLDALYDFLDGLVHVAFLEKAQVETAAVISPVSDQLTPLPPEKAEQLDVRERVRKDPLLGSLSLIIHFRVAGCPDSADCVEPIAFQERSHTKSRRSAADCTEDRDDE